MERSDIRERSDWRLGCSRLAALKPGYEANEKLERRPMMAKTLAAMLGGLSIGLIAMASANAQTVEQFYRGKTVTVLVGTSPGGINDITARFAAKHFGHFIPGNPLISVQYTPGGGGLVTANRIYNASERDGTVLAKLERATPQLAIQGYPQAQFDPTKLAWLGSMSSYADDAYLMLINADHPAKSIHDIELGGARKLTLGANNAASSNLIFGIIAKEVLHLNINVVRGYTGAAPLFLAMARKEIDGQLVGMSSVKTGQRDMWDKRAFRTLVQFGRTSRHPEFPDVPTGRELAPSQDMLSLIEFAEIPFFMSLPFVAPPGVPADRVKALQDAFMAMCRDPGVLDEAAKLGIDMSPITAEQILQLVGRMAATPKDVIARYNLIAGEKN
jgi:tripartite-type tricarboxylate transporter receptor subunit TctC